jgi:sec-independent protein translocase protein TatA
MGPLRPTHLIIIIAVLVLLFGARKLPDLALSLGRSMRILMAETKGLVDEPEPDDLDEKAEAQAKRKPLASDTRGSDDRTDVKTSPDDVQSGEVIDSPVRER